MSQLQGNVVEFFFFPWIKDGRVFPVLIEITKEALKLLSLAFGEFIQPFYGCH